jgi:uncharacterized damage-inducible protein DinB
MDETPKESFMPSTLDVIYDNWQAHNAKLRAAVAPLSDEQLRLQPAPGMWPLGQILQHIVSVRAGWFSGTLQDDDESMSAYMEWGERESPFRSAKEVAHALDETWDFIGGRIRRWSPEDCAQIFPDEWDGQISYVSRSWVISHVLEHDQHHGGEVSLILGMNGLPAIDV